ncbi:MAG: tRNA (adenosine(37)-N6)-dimethylallyltransferase MiaA [Syntrophomonadaceae bacterium]|nr:tRNA (adenosine(37)-N6)-dimethylallyltransferase MiaA [Syntrophomonadaceae bacterium]
MLKLAAIVGPTAVGKTELSIKIAQQIRGEIISCDSMQIYREMNIGTAKADPLARAKVPHHMLDIVSVFDDYSVADYKETAQQLIRVINQGGNVPILVGGTGLYYQAVVDDFEFFPMKMKNQVREKWQQIIIETGIDYAYQHLKEIDPDYARKISPNDQKRIIRGIEVYELTGNPFSIQQKRKTDAYNLAAVGLCLNRKELYERINTRVEDMIKQGLVEEVYNLKKNGCNLSMNSMQALGYKQVLYYLDGFITEREMIDELKKETRRYAKRQLTWFKKDKRIKWFEVMKQEEDTLVKKILYYLEGQLSNL